MNIFGLSDETYTHKHAQKLLYLCKALRASQDKRLLFRAMVVAAFCDWFDTQKVPICVSCADRRILKVDGKEKQIMVWFEISWFHTENKPSLELMYIAELLGSFPQTLPKCHHFAMLAT